MRPVNVLLRMGLACPLQSCCRCFDVQVQKHTCFLANRLDLEVEDELECPSVGFLHVLVLLSRK